MATPSPYPHTVRGAVYLQTGNVAPGAEALLEHTIPGRTIMVQAAYFARETRVEDTYANVLPAEILPENADIGAVGGALQLIPGNVSPGTTNISVLSSTSPFASSATTSADDAADNNTNSIWYNSSSESPAGAWWAIKTAAPEIVMSVEIVWFSSVYHAAFTVEMSVNGSTRTAVQSFSRAYGTGVQRVTLSQAVSANFFRLVFSNPRDSTYVVAREIRFERANTTGFPTSPRYATTAVTLDTTLWEANVQFGVDTFESPGVTSAAFLVSVDGRATWRYWDGAAWAVGALTSAAWGSASSSAGTLQQLTPTDWAALLSGSTSLDFAIQLATNNSNTTPVVSNLVLKYSTGTFRKVASDAEVELREYDDGKTVGVKNIGAVVRDFFVAIMAIPQP